MASRGQHAKRWSYWRGFLITLALIAGFAGCSSLSGYVTAEQPATTYVQR